MRATLGKMVAPKNRVLRILGGYQGSAEGEIARRPRLFPSLVLNDRKACQRLSLT